MVVGELRGKSEIMLGGGDGGVVSSWWHWGSCIYNDAKGHAGWAPLNAYRQTGDMHGVGGPCKGEVQPREERRRQNKGRRQRGGQGVTRAKRRQGGEGGAEGGGRRQSKQRRQWPSSKGSSGA